MRPFCDLETKSASYCSQELFELSYLLLFGPEFCIERSAEKHPIAANQLTGTCREKTKGLILGYCNINLLYGQALQFNFLPVFMEGNERK